MIITKEQLAAAATNILLGDVNHEMNTLYTILTEIPTVEVVILTILLQNAHDPKAAIGKAFTLGLRIGYNIGESQELEELAKL